MKSHKNQLRLFGKSKSINRKDRNPEYSGYAKNAKIRYIVF